MERYVQKIEKEIVETGDFKKIGIIGDPGCDGLGTYNLKMFAGAIKECNDADFILVVGDLVPTGSRKYYEMIIEYIENKAKIPVYVLPGNHDTGEYDKFFGKSDYAIVSNGKALVVLDNSKRKFTQEGLKLLGKILVHSDIESVYIAFHIPLPNKYTGNSVSAEECDTLFASIGNYRSKVKYFIAGHVHSRFEDIIQGIPMICTGGGGAIIEDVSEMIPATAINHHVVKIDVETGHTIIDIEKTAVQNTGEILRNKLADSVKDELFAHLKYLMCADRAEDRGLTQTAEVFRALASSEYHHARNFYSLLDDGKTFSELLEGFVETEEFEYNYIYKMLGDYCRDTEKDLSKTAYESARAAEKEHARLLENIPDDRDYEGRKLYVCPICGYVMEGDTPPERCLSCGRPSKSFEQYGK